MADTKKPAVKAPKKAAATPKKQPKNVNYNEMTKADLQKELVLKHQDLLLARRSQKSGELVNVRVISDTRKSIARIMTALNADKAVTKESK